MQKLHLVGFTTDHRGLIFSVRRGAKSGSYVVPLDDALLEVMQDVREQLQALAAETRAQHAVRPDSQLSVREMQARLRRGRTVHEVAKAAGVEESWVARFAVPVLAEQAEIIRTVRDARFERQRGGPSGTPLGEAVYRNLADRGVNDPPDQLDDLWRARQLRDGVWHVSFRHLWRGRSHEVTWELDEATGEVRALDRLGAQLAYRPGPARPARPVARKAPATRPSARKTSARKAPAKKAPAKKAPAKQTAAAKKNTKVLRPSAKRPVRADAKKKAASSAVRRPAPVRSAPAHAPRADGAPERRRDPSKRVAAARRAATARLLSETKKATKRDAAALRKAARRPLRRFPIAPEADLEVSLDVAADLPAIVDEVTPVDPPLAHAPDVGESDELLHRPVVESEIDPAAETTAAREREPEPEAPPPPDTAAPVREPAGAREVETAGEPGRSAEPEPATQAETAGEPTRAPEAEPRGRSARELLDELEQLLPPVGEALRLPPLASADGDRASGGSPRARRREPLRAPRDGEARADPPAAPRQRIRMGSTSVTVEAASGGAHPSTNGPVFDPELARQAGALPSYPTPDVEVTPPTPPALPAPAARRRRPLRGR